MAKKTKAKKPKEEVSGETAAGEAAAAVAVPQSESGAAAAADAAPPQPAEEATASDPPPPAAPTPYMSLVNKKLRNLAKQLVRTQPSISLQWGGTCTAARWPLLRVPNSFLCFRFFFSLFSLFPLSSFFNLCFTCF